MERVLNDRYKYQYDSELGYYRLYINNIQCPLKPNTLFKFYAANLNNVAALHEAYFWLSKPNDFNDPFDCNLNLIKFDEKLSFDSHPNDIADVGITCFSEEINEWLLWSHYTNNYKGFALEFNPETLRVKLNTEKRKFSLNPTIYLDQFPLVSYDDKFAMEYLLTAKSSRWAYEKEWRFICNVDEKVSYNRIIFYEPIAVKALYIGYKLRDEQESVFNLIESIFTTKYPGKPIYIVYPDPGKLDMVFHRRI